MKLTMIFVLLLFVGASYCWGSTKDKVKLKDVETLTLYYGRMTNGRRSNPVAQLQCVGGTAGCKAFQPQVVQCYNRGWDGYDVQWECKTDMDNAYRFGQVTVSCEGYEHRDDDYILRGSCGLEYTLDLTMEGHEKQKSSGHDYYGNQQHQGGNSYNSQTKGSKSSSMGSVIVLLIIGVVVYTLYKTCLNSRPIGGSGDDSGPDTGYPPRGGSSWFGGGGGGNPPAPGFRPEYNPNDGCAGGSQNARSSGPGFWSGAATGGLFGYLLGNQNNRNGPYGYSGRSYNTPDYNRDFGGTGSSYSPPRASSGGSSSGTRTASGFGGTSRR